GRKYPLKTGERIGEGSIVTEGNDAFLEMRFPDSSRAALSGPGEFGVSVKDRKKIRLRTGNLDVEMAPQPSGKAALIETGSAVVEVVGTRFLVEAAAASTTVSVSHGTVKLKRLADGETVEVRKDRIAVASLDAGVAFESRPIESVGGAWSAVPDELDNGKSIGGASSDFQAEAFRAGSDEQGNPVIHHGVSFRGTRGGSVGLAKMNADSELAVRFRVADPKAHVRIMVVCREATGGFVGNKQVQFRASEIAADADGSRTFRKRIQDFETITESDFSVAGRNVSLLVVSVLNSGDGLQVAGATITD
ncbi:MAG TPA: FecR domain-containing protein, partial [Luteolibacter sp.]|nr:FecR domain-containing protein [Luteolibacter sp.]